MNPFNSQFWVSLTGIGLAVVTANISPLNAPDGAAQGDAESQVQQHSPVRPIRLPFGLWSGGQPQAAARPAQPAEGPRDEGGRVGAAAGQSG